MKLSLKIVLTKKTLKFLRPLTSHAHNHKGPRTPNKFKTLKSVIEPVTYRHGKLTQTETLSCHNLMSTTSGDDPRTEDSTPTYAHEFSVLNCLIKITKGDITTWFIDSNSDAIVNAANERMLGGGGVDGAVHRAAGRKLREACYEVPQVEPGVRCPTGEARITPGFNLPASHIIHTVGPIYDMDENPEVLLKSAYRNTLTVAKENNIQYVAFPAISCGVYGYPYDEAASIAISTVKEFANDFKEVHFVLFSNDIYDAWLEKAKEIVGEEDSAQSANQANEIAGEEGSGQSTSQAKEIAGEEISAQSANQAKEIAGEEISAQSANQAKEIAGEEISAQSANQAKEIAGEDGTVQSTSEAKEIVGEEGSVQST